MIERKITQKWGSRADKISIYVVVFFEGVFFFEGTERNLILETVLHFTMEFSISVFKIIQKCSISKEFPGRDSGTTRGWSKYGPFDQFLAQGDHPRVVPESRAGSSLN